MSGLDFSELVAASAQLAAVPAAIVPKASRIARRAGFATVAGAQVRAPLDTGALKSSISVDIDGDGLGFTAGPEVDYGHFLEDGTHGPYIIPNAFGRGGYVEHPGISPQPYMGPAFDEQLDDVDTRLADAAAEVLR